ncbi:kinase-like protein [Aspergillus sclerotiicarbonarius CBS 121057]|uniref:Kinase-like protein n=1 Tax=Aspergillus sclerotiicarbonarius (strain CBS 121057 / IBT 28362) TaxID=1448318 RepID=A0A319E3N7_ASPSB|nr:kinase-like protein [Aspergillus sclerotiicarbonarius CBS 121057]
MSMPSRLRLYSRSSPPRNEFFENSSRRWIMNEEERLKERYRKFDPNELQRVAGRAIGEDHCPFMIKLAEGGFNKVFLLRADSGREVIARIPTPIAGPAQYTTASEVATMDFLRVILGMPIPKVLAYSTSSANPVGAEYIIMERIEGVSLASRWLSLTTEEVKSVMKQIAQMEQRVFTYSFPGYGSLYRQKDLQGEKQIPIPVEDFCIGPAAARQFWHGDRNKTKIDRGPWLSSKDCFTSAARRETVCILRHAKPQPRRTFLLPTLDNIEPSEHVSLLSRFLEIASFLIPETPDHNSPILRHPDLSLHNILLEPGSTKIASIIDWQDAVVFPIFMQAGYPAFCEHDLSQTQSLQRPSLPDDFDDMSIEEQTPIKTKFRLDEANLYYTATTGIYNDIHMSALKLPHLGMRQYLYQQTGYPWDADIINLRAALVGITTPQVWHAISSVPCPVSFTDQERQSAREDSNEWNESEKLLSAIRDHLGVDLEGGTGPENFQWASHRNLELRLEMVRQAEEHEREMCWHNWPFKDDTDMSSPPLHDDDW